MNWSRYVAPCVLLGMLVPSASALDRTLYVINGLAETLSRVDLGTNVVTNNTQTLGLVPNQIFIDNTHRRDTVGYVIHSGSHDLWLVHLETGAVIDAISLGPDRNPYSLAFMNDSMVAVTNLLANSVSEVDTKNGTVTNEYPVGTSPEGVVYHHGLLFVCITAFDFGTFLYGQGEVAIVDPDLDSVIARIPVGTNPQAALIDYENELLVLCTGDFATQTGMIYVIDPDSQSIKDSIPTGGWPGHMALAPDGHVYIAGGGWVGSGDMYLYDSHDHQMVRDAASPIAVGTGSVAAATDIFANGYSCNLSVDHVNRLQGTSVVTMFNLGDGPGFAAVFEPFPPGDVNDSRDVTTADIIFLINWLFRGGPAPTIQVRGDVSRNCVVTASDVITMVNYILKSGPDLQYGCY